MISLFNLLILVTQVSGQTGSTAASDTSTSTAYAVRASGLVLDSVITAPNTPVLLFEKTPGSPLVALRISVPRPQSASGAPTPVLSRSLISQAIERASGTAGLLGVKVVVANTPDRIGYQVLGTRREFEALAWVLRLLVERPTESAFGRALGEERRRQDRLLETPRGQLQARLDSETSRTGPTYRDLLDYWTLSHQPDSLRITVRGDLPITVVMAAFANVPASSNRVVGTLPNPSPTRERFRRILEWRGVTLSFGDTNDPAVALAGRVARDRISSLIMGSTVEIFLTEGVEKTRLGILAQARSRSTTERTIHAAEEALKAPLSLKEVETARADMLSDLNRQIAQPHGWLTIVDRYYVMGSFAGVHEAIDRLVTLGIDRVQTVFGQGIETLISWELGR